MQYTININSEVPADRAAWFLGYCAECLTGPAVEDLGEFRADMEPERITLYTADSSGYTSRAVWVEDTGFVWEEEVFAAQQNGIAKLPRHLEAANNLLEAWMKEG